MCCDGQNLHCFKRQLDNFIGKNPQTLCLMMPPLVTVLQENATVFALCNSLVASIGHQRRQMMDRQWVFVRTNMSILSNKVTLRHVCRSRQICEFAMLDSDRLSAFSWWENSVLWSKAAQILQMSFSNKVVISLTPV